MPVPIEIDVRTRFIADDQRCYIVFPGNGYRFYNEMAQSNGVFLDLPGFPLYEDEDLAKAKNILQRTILSERIKLWHDGGKKGEEPPREVQQVGRFRTTTARLQFAGLVRGFLTTLKRGDVVVVPCKDYEGQVLFGEIADDEPQLLEIARYGDDYIPYWPVIWQGKMTRESIPGWLERKIPSPNPLRQIEFAFHNSIYDIMYKRYYFNNQFTCKFDVGSSQFSSLDDYLFQQIILYVAALHARNQEGNHENIEKISLSAMAASVDKAFDIPELRVNINSPGHIVVYTKNIIPLVAGALMTLASISDAALAKDITSGKVQISVVNSADRSHASAECIADLQKEVEDDLAAMGYNRWRELCEVEVRARERTKLNPGMGVVKP